MVFPIIVVSRASYLVLPCNQLNVPCLIADPSMTRFANGSIFDAFRVVNRKFLGVSKKYSKSAFLTLTLKVL
jgi:hypothetical protein